MTVTNEIGPKPLIDWMVEKLINETQLRALIDQAEVERILRIYGPVLTRQHRFLKTYSDIIELSGIRPNTNVYERADLLARFDMIDIQGAPAVGFDGYHSYNVERVQTYGRAALEELEADFAREGNPVHAWEALTLISRYGISSQPVWVRDYLASGANRIMEIRAQVANGQPAGREAERVGKALRFGLDGKGQGAWFKHATMLERDRRICRRIAEKQAAGIKLDAIYSEVAKDMDVSRSMIQRAYTRLAGVIKRRNQDDSQ